MANQMDSTWLTAKLIYDDRDGELTLASADMQGSDVLKFLRHDLAEVPITELIVQDGLYEMFPFAKAFLAIRRFAEDNSFDLIGTFEKDHYIEGEQEAIEFLPQELFDSSTEDGRKNIERLAEIRSKQ